MGKVSSYRAGHSNKNQQQNKSSLKSNRFQGKLFRQQVQIQKEQTPDHQRIGAIKANNTYSSSLTSTQQLILLFTIMGILLPVATAHQKRDNSLNNSGKDSKLAKINQLDTKEAYSSQAVTLTEPDIDTKILYFMTHMPYPELKVKQATNLRELLYQKTFYDEDVLSSKEEFRKCEYIVDKILETMKELPSSEGHIERSIEDPRFQLHCIAEDKFPNGNFGGIFKQDENRMYIKTSMADDERERNIQPFLHHEFRHADFTLLHQNEGCNTNEKDARGLPFFPTTPEMVDRFKQALDRGSARIRQLELLFKKEADKKPLNTIERELLNKYKAASRGCFAYLYTISLSTSEYKDLLAQSGWKESRKKEETIVVLPGWGGELKLVELGGAGNKYSPYFAIIKVDGLTSLRTTLFRVDQRLKSIAYEENSLNLQLTEREAHTMESLSVEAMRVFYPEAYQMTQEFIERCNRKGLIEIGGSLNTDISAEILI
jgi:hypothetical protein